MRLLIAVIAGVFGLLFGSFLNVVVYRVPRKMSIVRPGSRCPNCGRELTAFDNIPVLSWVLLRARCRTCHEPISIRYPLGELGTGLLWFGAFWRITDYPVAALYAALFWVLLALALIDLDHKILPNAIVYPATVVGVVAFVAVGAGLGQFGWALRGLEAGAAAFAFFLGLALLVPGGMGMGDVKLSFLVGLGLGFLSWKSLAVGFLLSFMIGAVAGLALMALGKAGRKSTVPFGPFMALGAALTILFNAALVHVLPGW